jgi:hypothetical protein
MKVGAVEETFAAFGIGATYTPAGGEPVPVTRAPATSSLSAARPSSSRASRSGAIRIGSVELDAMFLLVPQVKLSKRGDVARAAERWSTQLSALIEQGLRAE